MKVHEPSIRRSVVVWGAVACLTGALLGAVIGGMVVLAHEKGRREGHDTNGPPLKHERRQLSKGFYVHPKEGRFLKLAAQAGTDKVNFEAVYQDIFERGRGFPKLKKMMEIGLGCNMDYGPGKSASLWRSYFPDAEVWFAEYDAKCVAEHQDKLRALNVKAVVGDQADPPTVRKWINQTGGDFDFIVDDGGHGNNQQYVSFIMLFQHALKPGGVFVIEDLSVSRIEQYQGGLANSKLAMVDVLRDWVEALMTFPTQLQQQKGDLAYQLKHKMPPGIKSIQCSKIACAVVKCYADDDADCSSYGNYVDKGLKDFGMA